MNLNPEIYSAIEANNNMITTADVLSMGFSRMLLSKYVKPHYFGHRETELMTI